MKNGLIYFISDFILILGFILSIFRNFDKGKTITGKPAKPGRHLNFLICILVFMLIGFLPVCSTLFTNIPGVTQVQPLEISFLNNSIIVNSLGFVFKFLITLSALVCTVLSYGFIKKLNHKTPKFITLFLSALIGAYGITAANDFISLFVSIEILSMAVYFLISCFNNTDVKCSRPIEAGIKYFIINETASCFMLLGISYIYLCLGTINFADISLIQLNKILPVNPLLNIAEILLFLSLVFKIGAFPLYLWVMDVFKGSDYSAGVFISSVVKITAVLAIIKPILSLGYFGSVLNFALILSAVITLIIGNLLALRIVKKEGPLKDFLGASTIANIGYVFLGISFLTVNSITSAIYYLIAYLIMNFALWGGFMLISRNFKKQSECNENLSALKGISYISPFFGTVFSICIFSFAGLPPAIGFSAKFYLFVEILRSGVWAVYPLIFAGLASIFAVYYYFKIIYIIFSKPQNMNIYKRKSVFDKFNAYTFVLSICAILLIAGFFMSAPLIDTLKGIL